MTDNEPQPDFELDQYFTPPDLALEFAKWANPLDDYRILEPSAGTGNLCLAAMDEDVVWGADVTGVEFDPEKVKVANDRLRGFGLKDYYGSGGTGTVIHGDYLTWTRPGKRYDLALMNPPYTTVPGIDAMFVCKAAQDAARVCAIVRAVFLNGVKRKALCHDHVIYTRIKYLARRPRFGGPHSAKADFIFVECHERQEGETQEGTKVKVEFE